jgi:hypothetical protein
MRYLGLQPAPHNKRPAMDRVKKQMRLAVRVRNKFFNSLKPEIKV